ncbi:hypothetical protein POTOM_032232 [Populus tomentosa]|uniref:P-type ATPase C-terminal domain-containing protein n=1 Tax=Populus tomentosa TaxID=118781 RepID=A0A8X7Z918_POPTO|nr:hypothetical protein POTOM_032232 [Populus tomentosa]
MSGGWERARGSRSRPTRDSSSGLRMSSRTATLGNVQPQAPGHRTIYCNDRDANLRVRFKAGGELLFSHDLDLINDTNQFREKKSNRATELGLETSSPVNPVTNVVPLTLVLLVSLIKEAFEDWCWEKCSLPILLFLNCVQQKRFQNDMVINNTLIDLLQDEKWVAVPWKKLQVGDIIRSFFRDACHNLLIIGPALTSVTYSVKQDGFFPADLLFLASTNADGVCYVETANLDGETNLKIRKALERTWDYLTPEKAAEFKGEVQCEQPNNSLYTFTGNLMFQKQTLPLSPNQVLLRGCSLRNTEYIVGAVVFTGHETKVMMNSMNVPSKRSTLERKLDKLILALFGTLFMMCLIGAIGSGMFINRKYYYLGLDKGVAAEFNPSNRFVVAALTFFTLITLYSTIIPISLYVSIEMIKFIQSTQFINKDLHMYHAETNTPALARTSNLNEELGQLRKSAIAIQEKGFNFDDHRLMRGAWRNEPNSDSCKYVGCSLYMIVYSMRTTTMIYILESHVEKMGKIQDVAYEILNVLEFNSTRKRQSVVCRYPNGRLVLYCKGADTVIYERLAGGNDDLKKVTRSHLEQFGSAGLRTLCLAYRDLSPETYESWNEKFIQAKSSLRDPCNLINNEMKQFIISSETDAIREVENRGDQVEIACFIKEEVKKELTKYLEEAQHYLHSAPGPKLTLVIDGKCLMYALNPTLRVMLLNLSLNCTSVVCCRVSPLQKAQKLLKSCTEIEFAFSKVKEYCASERDGKNLLLVHGRWSYLRICKVITYFFYKNLTFTLTQFWFTFQTGFSGQRFYDDWFQSLYNVIFTALPVIIVGLFDKDVSASLSKKYPELYREGIRNVFFKWRVVVTWACFSVYQSLVFYHFVIASSASGKNSSGRMLGQWDISTMAFTCVVITVNLRLLMICNSITRWHYISVGGSILAWFIFIFVYSVLRENVFFVIYVLMSTFYFYLTVLLVPIVALFGDFIYLGIQRWFFPYDFQIVQEIHRHELEDNTSAGLLDVGSQLTPQEGTSHAMAPLSREISRHSGFAFESPGYESFFASEQGIHAQQKPWDVARRASMRSKRKMPKRN